MKPTNVNESLKQLLTELQKVKDLNNLANDYKEVAANLTLSLQQYLTDSQEFSKSFSDYIVQTNQSVENTKTALDNTTDVIRNAMKQFNATEDKLDTRINALSTQLSKLGQHEQILEDLYRHCVSQELQIQKDTEALLSKTVKDFSHVSTETVGKVESLQSHILSELSRSNQILLDAFNTTEKLIDDTGRSINQILTELTESRKENRQMSSFVIGTVNSQQVQTRKEIEVQSKSIEASIERYYRQLSSQTSKSQRMEWMILGFLAVEIILLIVLIVK